MKPNHPDYEFSTKVLNSMDGKGLMDLHDKLHRTPYHKLKNTKNTRSEIQNKILNKAFNYSDIYNNFHEAKEKQEYDYEGDMAMSQLKSIIANAQRIHDMLERDTNIPEWVQSKITLAEDYITTAANYMQGEMKEDVDAYADALIRRNKQNLNKGHVVNAARIAGMDDKKLMAAVNKKVGRIKEEVTHSVHVKTYDSHGEKQMNSPEFKKHVTAHGGEMDYVSDKGAAFKFKSASHAAQFHRGVQSKFRELDSEHDMHEEVAMGTGPVNVAANVADPQNKKLFAKPVKRFKSFTGK